MSEEPNALINPASTVTEESVYAALREVYDPELPVNIVDLGLVYQVKIIDGWVGVKMSLTSPGCGLADQIAADAREKVLHVPGVLDADVRIVWQPAWNTNFMTPEARKKLIIVK
jgi:metal-sulfur cluster biosynthetic enzyme